ncbi:hypothetical protein R3W88_024356 [Solanum pinnatisectum]|uniref:Pectin acetylesterase n=1 Tax=Solanum pinnatisectum TaxID=50273 RepID=A0AAV9M0W6_9SOLN|nr:hypothetical protein R3W88_024356 [Solanum pinnatisectum]
MVMATQLFSLLEWCLTIMTTKCEKICQDPDGYYVRKIIVDNAVQKGAVCLDGSPPAYHFEPGLGEGVENWIVHLSATNLHFRGARIFEAIMEELLVKGLKNAKNAILAGSSAAGYPTTLYCDHFRGLLTNTPRVKCLIDSGYFIHENNPQQARGFEHIYHALITLHGSAKALPKSCTSKMKPLLLFPKNMPQYIKTPLFIYMSSFDSFQIQTTIDPNLYGFIETRTCNASQKKTLKGTYIIITNYALPKSNNPKLRGSFIDSLNQHTSIQKRWFPENVVTIDNLSAPKAFADWYFDRKHWYIIDKHDMALPKYGTECPLIGGSL